jgi:AbrB family looped-hinge helix DNA binding protein
VPESTLSSKGQLVIPKKIREYMRLETGDRLDFVIRDDGDVVIRPVVSDVRELRGALQRKGRKKVSDAAMKKAVRKRAGRSA